MVTCFVIGLFASVLLLEKTSAYQYGARIPKIPRKELQKCAVTSDNSYLELNSPAKLNLFLRITDKYPNGYHQLCSLFQTVSLSDRLCIRKLAGPSTKDVMTCTDSVLVTDNNNLVIKALDLMRTKTNVKQYFNIHLQKNIPMQAGLGGGSGNAATAMFAFNALCGYPANMEQMRDWAAEIGSDISFFFSSGTAYCTGRGEHVQSLKPMPDSGNLRVLILKPREGLSTAKVFQQLQLSDCSTSPPLELLHRFQTEGALKAASQGFLVNDLEKPAFHLLPQLAQLRDLLGTQWAGDAGTVRGSMMTGSGSCVFALVDVTGCTEDALGPAAAALIAPLVAQTVQTVQTVVDGSEALSAGVQDHYVCRFVQRDAADVRAWY